MSDYTETEHVGFFSNLKNALIGLVVGLILFVASFPVLFWNEGRAVHRAQDLEEGQASVVNVQADKVDSANESKLVHMSGELKTDAKLKDPMFNVVVNAVGLKREAVMYQWRENVKEKKKDKIGGGTEIKKTYTYEKVWSKSPIDSSKFKKPEGRTNPSFNIDQKSWQASHVSLGAFNLTDKLISQYNKYTPLKITEAIYKQMPKAIKDRFNMQDGGLYTKRQQITATAPTASPTGVNTTGSTISSQSAEPQIGDIRIKFHAAIPGTSTVMAMQVGNSFSEFPTRGGKSHLEQTLAVGKISSTDMFNKKIQSNIMMTWILRVAGLAAMFIGICLLMAPLKAVANILPFLTWLVDGATMIIAGLVTIILGPLTIGLGWVTYRPLVGIPLMAVSVIGLFLLIQNRAKASKERKAATA